MELTGLGKGAFIQILSYIHGPVINKVERLPDRSIITHYYKDSQRVATFRDRFKSGFIEDVNQEVSNSMTLNNNIYVSEYEILNSIYSIKKVDNNWILFNKLTNRPYSPPSMFSTPDLAYSYYLNHLRSDSIW